MSWEVILDSSRTHWDGELIAGARLGQRSGYQSDSIKDSKQQELIEKERRWVPQDLVAPIIPILPSPPSLSANANPILFVVECL
jgi:hypothetical protein